MVKAMQDAGYPDLGCFAHKLQGIVHDGVLSQTSVIDILSICRWIVGHFKHPPLAYRSFHAKSTQKNPYPHRFERNLVFT